MRDAISLLDQLLSYGDEVLDAGAGRERAGLVDQDDRASWSITWPRMTPRPGLQLINQMVAERRRAGPIGRPDPGLSAGVLFAQVVHAADGLDLPEEAAASGDAPGRSACAGRDSWLRCASTARRVALLRDQVPGVPQLPIEMAFLRTALAPARSGRPAG